MKKIIQIVCLLLLSFSSKAAVNLDSLLQVVENPDSFESKIDALNKLGWELRLSEPDKALAYIGESLELLKKKEYLFGYAQALNNLGCTQTLIGKFEEADSVLNKSFELYQQMEVAEEAGKTLTNIGINWYYRGNVEKAIEYAEKALPFFNDFPERKAKSYQNIGVFYRTLGKYDKAIEHYLGALTLFRELEDTYAELNTLNNIGNMYMFYRQYDKAIEYHEEAKKIAVENGEKEQEASAYGGIGQALDEMGMYDESIENSKIAYEKFHELGIAKQSLVAEFNIANTLMAKGELDKAFDLFTKVKNGFVELNALDPYISTVNSIGLIYYERKQYDSAIVYMEESLEQYKRIQNPTLYKQMLMNLSKAYEEIGRTEEALQLQHVYNVVKDSLYDVEVALQVAQTEAKFRLEEKEKEIEQTKNELSVTAEKKEALEKSIINYWYVIVLLGIGSFVLIIFYSKKRKQVKLAAQQKEDILRKYKSLEEAYDKVYSALDHFQNNSSENISEEISTMKPLPDWVNELSKRELEVLSCLAVGMTDKEISEKLFISLATVRTHCRRIYGKLLVKNRSEAANFAREFQLI